jgi:hypothetical protein
MVCVRKDDSYTLKILIVLATWSHAMIKPCGMKLYDSEDSANSKSQIVTGRVFGSFTLTSDLESTVDWY